MFEAVSPQVSFPALDAKILAQWEEQKIFQRVAEREGPPFVFYEGPPTANGMPHAGHVLTRVMKDVFLRYRSMCGYRVPRRAGWDTHGLPVEVEVEKELGISGRAAIAEYGVEAFSKKCIDSVFRYIGEWRKMTNRIGFWVDLDDAYVTFHKRYVESEWWALKRLFDEGLLYQDYKVVWWWAQGGTALSMGEVGQGYKEVDDPSVMVRFPIRGPEGATDGTSFLAWTTTPWTLPSNVALAVKADATYATVKLEDGSQVVLAEALVAKVIGDAPHEVVETKPGSEWVGAEYVAPFDYAKPEGGPAHRVIAAPFVELGSGTGMVHLAPAFGEDDFKACKAEGLGFLQLVQADGTFPPEVTDFAGRFCKEADRDIIRLLKKKGILFKEEVYRHDYPFSWRRMSDPLIQYARTSWFIKTTREAHRAQENNQAVNWEPGHIKDGRFGQFLAGNVDWALSRERFWGTPLPIWVNDVTGKMEAVDSAEAILAKNPKAFDHFHAAKEKDPTLAEDLMVHKPWIDEVTWTVPGEEGVYRRVPEVIDCWFDSGCMPFAQLGYPHHNQEEFEKTFPADFITEAVDQTRGWFYSLMMISTLLFEKQGYPHPFKNCVVLGLLTDEKGLKYSKSLKNYTDPLKLMDDWGGDSVRWALYTNTVPGQNTRFFEGAVRDAAREFLLKVWNVYSFFVTYANLYEKDAPWTAAHPRPAVAERSDLDRWILAELDFTVRKVRAELDGYTAHQAVRHVTSFVDSLSNWYVRRSRPRFWAEGDGADKQAAFATLYEVLVELCRLVAPFVPFVAEAMYGNLCPPGDASRPAGRRAASGASEGSREGAPTGFTPGGGGAGDSPSDGYESVHLAPFPTPNDERADDALRESVALARQLVTAGNRVRNEAKLKVRQPLGEAIVVVANDEERAAIERFSDAIREELNVMSLAFTTEPAKYVDFQLLPNFPKLGPRLGKELPICKKVLGEADGSALHAELSKSGQITITLPSGPIALGPEEVQVRLQAKEGFAAASEAGRVVVLDTHVTPELRKMGLAREVTSKIQRVRKDRDLPYDARLVVTWQAEGELAEALEAHGASIAAEVLATRFERGAVDETTEVDGHTLGLGVTVV
ncbi:MAG: isoleucine--tRNA ligase [Sandaracinus sp.]|nr:isoleucine--tRNA ligase [Sandaracinus sp.]